MIHDEGISFEMMSEGIGLVKSSYSDWELSQNESPIEFIQRKRKVDLVYLLNDVIDNELSDLEKQIVNLYYFNSKTATQIASVISLNKSTVTRKLNSINKKIYDFLKYAVMYKYDLETEDVIPLALRETATLSAVKSSSPNYIGGRIFKLRTLADIDFYTLSNCTGIDEDRLKTLEKSNSEIKTCEAVIIASFFNVSIDYLLTGKTKGD